MTSPSLIPPTAKTTGSRPAVKSIGCSDGSELKLEMMPRNGMYSPNGTSWRLTYVVVGPRPGAHSWPTLRRGSFSTSPTRIGLPIAATAADSSAYTPGFWNGSRSVAFSGQITRSGAGRWPAFTCAASFSVAATWFCVTWLALSCCGRFLARGTLPWIAATWAVGAPPVGSAGSSPPASTTPAVTTAAAAAPSRREIPPKGGQGGLGGIVPPEETPREHGAGQGDQEGQQRHPAERDPADVRRDRLAHRQPAPGKGVRPPVPHPLDQDPPARHRDRPVPQAQQQPLADGEHREDDRLGPGQRGPRVPGLVDQPGQQGHELRQAECQRAAERRPQAPPGQRDHEQRGPEHRQRPGVYRRERGVQRQPPRHRDEQRPARPETGEIPGAAGPRAGGGSGLGGDHPESVTGGCACVTPADAARTGPLPVTGP